MAKQTVKLKWMTGLALWGLRTADRKTEGLGVRSPPVHEWFVIADLQQKVKQFKMGDRTQAASLSGHLQKPKLS